MLRTTIDAASRAAAFSATLAVLTGCGDPATTTCPPTWRLESPGLGNPLTKGFVAGAESIFTNMNDPLASWSTDRAHAVWREVDRCGAVKRERGPAPLGTLVDEAGLLRGVVVSAADGPAWGVPNGLGADPSDHVIFFGATGEITRDLRVARRDSLNVRAWWGGVLRAEVSLPNEGTGPPRLTLERDDGSPLWVHAIEPLPSMVIRASFGLAVGTRHALLVTYHVDPAGYLAPRTVVDAVDRHGNSLWRHRVDNLPARGVVATTSDGGALVVGSRAYESAIRIGASGERLWEADPLHSPSFDSDLKLVVGADDRALVAFETWRTSVPACGGHVPAAAGDGTAMTMVMGLDPQGNCAFIVPLGKSKFDGWVHGIHLRGDGGVTLSHEVRTTPSTAAWRDQRSVSVLEATTWDDLVARSIPFPR